MKTLLLFLILAATAAAQTPVLVNNIPTATPTADDAIIFYDKTGATTYRMRRADQATFGQSLTSLNAASLSAGNISIARFNSGSGASSTTYWRGDGTWAALDPDLVAFVTNAGWTGSTLNLNGSLTAGSGTIVALELGAPSLRFIASSFSTYITVTDNMTASRTVNFTFPNADTNLVFNGAPTFNGDITFGSGTGAGRGFLNIYPTETLTFNGGFQFQPSTPGANLIIRTTAPTSNDNADLMFPLTGAMVSGGFLHTIAGPTAARIITVPDANFTVARTDAANNFTGTQSFGGNVVLGTGGSNIAKAMHGTAQLASGVVTVSNSSVVDTGTPATSSRVIVTRHTDGGTVSYSYSITRSNGTSFTITGKTTGGATQTADTSYMSWLLINP